MQIDSATRKTRCGLAGAVPWLVLSALCVACLWPGSVEGREALVVWSCSPEEDVAGYTIHYGPASREDAGFSGYAHTVRLEKGEFTESKGTAQYRLEGLGEETTYWFAMTAFDYNGNESDFSNEKVLSAPGDPDPDKEVSSGGGGGCQTAPGEGSRPSCRSGMPAWLLVGVGVPLWILGNRRIWVGARG